jgi:hypothetical protein
MKNLKSYEVITGDGKSHFISAYSKKNIKNFWVSSLIKKIIKRKDIDVLKNINI